MGFFTFIVTASGLAFDSIRAHKLRSFLTLLGVIVGVASVVLVGAAIDGLGVYAEQITSKAFGTNSFLLAQIASVGRLSGREFVAKQKYNKRLRVDDLKALRVANGDEVLYSTYQQRIEDVKAHNQVFEAANVIGVSSDMPTIRDIPVIAGRFFSDTEERRHQPVAVIGEDIHTTLFPGQDPMGGTLKISGVDFTIVGLLERQGSSFGQSLDNPVYVPSTVYQSMFGGGNNVPIFGRAKPGSGLNMTEALDVTRNALRSRFHTRLGKPDNFDNLTPDSVR